MPEKRNILYAVLDWGIGHATRSLPIIRKLAEDHNITVMSTGRSLNLLRSELPETEMIDHPDYSVRYTRKKWTMLPSLAMQLPRILLRIGEEHRYTERLVQEKKFDRIISDNRYGVYSEKVPSFLITHQLRFKLPGLLSPAEKLSEYFCRKKFRHFKRIFVPDEAQNPCLSGSLSHTRYAGKDPRIIYCGILADLKNDVEDIPSDLLFIISGPEPQRTIFENRILEQAENLDGTMIVVRGVTESREESVRGGMKIYSSVERDKLSAMIRGAKAVVSRPGYSTVMELTALRKKALFIPTPGQTEQEYLAEYYRSMNYFPSVPQHKMELFSDTALINSSEPPVLIPNRIGEIIDEIVS